jgi:hypothetical protein
MKLPVPHLCRAFYGKGVGQPREDIPQFIRGAEVSQLM